MIMKSIGKSTYSENSFVIKINGSLTSSTSLELRESLKLASKDQFDTIYIDAKDVDEVDLSGINEVIHSHYNLQLASKKLVLICSKKSNVNKWVEITGLNKFIEIIYEQKN